MGGIGLPGGAVYIETWRLRSRWWVTAVSLAGPTSNLVIAIGLAIVLQFDFVANSLVGPGLAFLALLQVTAALFNMLPVPPFDGYGALRPHLNEPLRMQIDNFGRFSMWIVILLFWYVPVISGAFWSVVYIFAGFINIPIDLSWLGYDQFMFWR
jgi:Zn-dependent protease